MIYILFFSILFLFILSYYIFKRNLLNPSVVLCGVFLISLFFLILNFKEWQVEITEKTTLTIIMTIVFFMIGNLVIYCSLKKKKVLKNDIRQIYPIGIKKIILIDTLLLLGLFYYINNIYKISLLAGNTEGYKKMLVYARIARLEFYNIDRISINIFYIAKAVSYLCIYSFLKFSFQKSFKIKNIYLLSPVIIYLIFTIFSTGRTEIIYLFIYSLIMYFTFLYRKYNFSVKVNKKIIIGTFLAWSLFTVFFFISGVVLGRSDNQIFKTISKYTGSSLAALNYYINNYTGNNNNIYFGQNTMFRIYNVLRRFNNNIPNFYVPYEFVYFNNMQTNIYSAIRRYIEDYGILGLYSISLFLGSFYGVFFNYVTYQRKDFWLIMYAVFSFPIFEFPIEERFFMSLFPTGFINNFIFMGILYYFLIYRPNRKEYNKKRNQNANK